MALIDQLRDRLTQAVAAPEARSLARGLDVTVAFVAGQQAVGIVCSADGPMIAATPGGIDITLSAAENEWREALAPCPLPTYHSFSSIQLRNPNFVVTGDALVIAQARAFLEAIFAHLTIAEPAHSEPDLTRLSGRYHRVRSASSGVCDIYAEAAGQGAPILCLHTAGADARQFHGVMCDPHLGRHWRLIGFDMPHHGRSLPPLDWDGGSYSLDQATYLDWCISFIEQTVGEPVVVIGCSMGAGIALALAAERPDLVKAVIALEAPLRPRGRRNPYLTHAKVNGGWHSAAYVRGLMSPSSSAEDRRRAAWIYSQGAPGVYDGDLAFYSDEFDGEPIAKRIDGGRIPVHLMIGHYDFSATVADAHALAGWIDGATVTEMPELGHFPMTENPPRLLEYLRPVLATLKPPASPSR
ncbi:alpha/beta hydrolase [Rhodopseudomonas palustris]|uniref:Alpha/beta hydrolase n=1 Tax=Rhodopseudomonas palustris TaxID=1076 RepID=A0A323UJV2_RHOPL|nr:alpha/beta hydrolase [Rhodopseudomonas palustris]PZA11890.1 alpha/beta hydrolase [Rhodopseudomonas palustris]